MVRVSDLNHVPEQLRVGETVPKIILDPRYGYAGFAAMRSGSWVYIVGNLVQMLEDLSDEQVEDLVIQTIQHRRTVQKIPPFKVIPMHELHDVACSMVKKDSLKISPINPYIVGTNRDHHGGTSYGTHQFRAFSFTASDPRVLSDAIQGPTDDPSLNAVSVGVCFGKSATYPTGTYWIVLEFYNYQSGPRDY